jgi:hypothetical protein
MSEEAADAVPLEEAAGAAWAIVTRGVNFIGTIEGLGSEVHRVWASIAWGIAPRMADGLSMDNSVETIGSGKSAWENT